MQTSWIVRIWPERMNLIERVPLYLFITERYHVIGLHEFPFCGYDTERNTAATVKHRESLRYMDSLLHANSAVNSCEKICVRDGMRAPMSLSIIVGRSPMKRNENFTVDKFSSSLSTSTVWSVMMTS